MKTFSLLSLLLISAFLLLTTQQTFAQTPPTITDITNQTVSEDVSTGALAFTVGDAETAADALTVFGTSDNTTLVPNGYIVFIDNIGADRTITVTPATNQTGTATITVTVSDGSLTSSDTFLLTVIPVNDAPTISNISDQNTDEDTPTGAINFTIGDMETAASSLTVTGTSDNTTLVPNNPANIVLGGSGVSRNVSIVPAANQSGAATITLTVSDGSLTSSDTFLLTVISVNDAPTISDISDQSTNKDTPTGAINFTIGDMETAASSLTVTGTSDNITLVPNSNILFGGSGASRTVTVTPATNQTGTATITVTVSDGSLTGSDTFLLTVIDPTPVQMVSFTAAAGHLSAQLRWITATEIDNYGFEIERRKVDQSSWLRAGFVSGAGTSSSPNEYSFEDRGLSGGRYAYRIKQIDKDGRFKYHEAVEIEIGLAPREFTLSQNYPNPFNPNTTIEFTLPDDGHVSLRMYDVTGREAATFLDEERPAGYYHQVTINASHVGSGSYFLRLEFGGKQLTKRIVLIK